MPRHRFNFELRATPGAEIVRANLLAFIGTPEGMEFFADRIHEVRRLVAKFVNGDELEMLRDAENDLRAKSARPLPPELDV